MKTTSYLCDSNMPRYCAVKACRNRGGSASRQDKRISFYPFPLQDKPRLKKWVNNIHREKWTPSRHQYLCSDHFTDDCFDIRWGIRYLKNTAIPTIFPPSENDSERKITTFKRSPKATEDTGIEQNECSYSKRSIILCQTSNNFIMTIKNEIQEDKETIDIFPVGVIKLPFSSNSAVSCQSKGSQSASCELVGDTIPTAPCFALSPYIELHSDGQPDSAVTVLCCESDEVAAVDTSGSVDLVPNLVPVENIKAQPNSGSFLEERGPSEGEKMSIFEHSYSRPHTGRDQLWSKIVSLHAKILELDHKEECTVAKIHALETEIALLKRDGAAFREKQKVLEEYISTILL